jgi:hypothetical protein
MARDLLPSYVAGYVWLFEVSGRFTRDGQRQIDPEYLGFGF